MELIEEQMNIEDLRASLREFLYPEDWTCCDCAHVNSGNIGWCQSASCIREKIYSEAAFLLRKDKQPVLAKRIEALYK